MPSEFVSKVLGAQRHLRVFQPFISLLRSIVFKFCLYLFSPFSLGSAGEGCRSQTKYRDLKG